SIQMTARISGRPRSSTGTVPDHWALHPTPVTRPGAIPAPPGAPRGPRTTASHQSAGSCSTPPPPSTCSGYRSTAEATTSPRTEKTAAFTPEVPRSRATTYSSALVTEGPSRGQGPTLLEPAAGRLPLDAPRPHRDADSAPGQACSVRERCGTVWGQAGRSDGRRREAGPDLHPPGR